MRSVVGEFAVPEGLPLAFFAPIEGAEVADGIGSVLLPTHAGQLQSLAYDRLARALHRAAADAPAPCQVLGVFHPVRVPLQVTDQPIDRFAQARPTRPVPFAQHRRQDRAAFLLQELTPLPRLILSLVLVLRGQQPRQPGELLRRVKEVKDDHFHTREILPEPVFQPVATVGEPNPKVGAVHADMTGGRAEQRAEVFQGVQPREVTRLHRQWLLVRPRPLGAGVADHAHVGHPALGWATLFTLLPDAGGVELDVGAPSAVVVLVPGPIGLGAKGCAGLDGLRQALTGVFGGPFDGGLSEPDTGHLFEQIGALLEAVGDHPGQGGDPLQGRCQPPCRQPCRFIEGEDPLTTAPAQIVGARVADGTDEAQGGVGAVRVELGRLAAVWAGHAGALVSVFFCASRCSMALAATLWARARIRNSLSPKTWASSAVARLAASSLISASAASRMARARSSTSACFSGGRGADSMMDSVSRTRFCSTGPPIPLVYKNSTNF